MGNYPDVSAVKYLGNPRTGYARIDEAVGSHTAGTFLCQMMYWLGTLDGHFKGSDPEGWIYKTRDEIKDETGLGRREQETARKRLRKLGILEEKKDKRPGDWCHVLWFRVNDDAFNKVFWETWGTRLFGDPDEDVENPSDTRDKEECPTVRAESAQTSSPNAPKRKGGRRPPFKTETTGIDYAPESTPARKEKESSQEAGLLFLDDGRFQGDTESIAEEIRGLLRARDKKPQEIEAIVGMYFYAQWIKWNDWQVDPDPRSMYNAVLKFARKRYGECLGDIYTMDVVMAHFYRYFGTDPLLLSRKCRGVVEKRIYEAFKLVSGRFYLLGVPMEAFSAFLKEQGVFSDVFDLVSLTDPKLLEQILRKF